MEQVTERLGGGHGDALGGEPVDERRRVVSEVVDVLDQLRGDGGGQVDLHGPSTGGKYPEVQAPHVVGDLRVEGPLKRASARGEHARRASVHLRQLVLELFDGGGGGDDLGRFVPGADGELGHERVVMPGEHAELFAHEVELVLDPQRRVGSLNPVGVVWVVTLTLQSAATHPLWV